jgi:hypothetical protein
VSFGVAARDTIDTISHCERAMSQTPAEDRTGAKDGQRWEHILRGTGSPLKLFALVTLICNTVFACAAAVLGDPTTFLYCIHMFLGVVGTFSVIALFSPRSLYHPTELNDIPEGRLPENKPLLPFYLIVGVLIGYSIYQYVTPTKPVLIPERYKVFPDAGKQSAP